MHNLGFEYLPVSDLWKVQSLELKSLATPLLMCPNKKSIPIAIKFFPSIFDI